MKRPIIYIGACLISLSSFGQSLINLNQSPGAGTHETCEGYSLKPGFKHSAAASGSLILRTSVNACLDPKPTLSGSVPSTTQNYIMTRTHTYGDYINSTNNTPSNAINYLDVVQYFDGLGRPIQTVSHALAPDGSDIVTYQEYDAVGRESNQWLPIKVDTRNGSFVSLATVSGKATATYADAKAYLYPEYEPSPLNRIAKQYGPGTSWHNSHAVSTTYLTNTGTTGELMCGKYTTSDTRTQVSLSYLGTYNTGELYVTKVTDEDGNVSYEFKDKLGQVVLTRQMNGNTPHDTYYIYDSYGNLRAVLPPLAADVLKATGTNLTADNSDLAKYAYLYKYDNRNRCVEKKLPGAGWVKYVYDKADRLIFTQDAEQRKSNKWTYSIPDSFGRIVLTGVKQDATITNAKYEQLLVTATYGKGSVDNMGYTISDFEITNSNSIHTANFYDTHNFLDKLSQTHLEYATEGGYGAKYDNHKGLQTGSCISLTSGVSGFSAMFYDERGRLIQSKSDNHLKGVESEYIAYNFTGRPTKKKHVHTAFDFGTPLPTQTELYVYSYDHAGRPVKTTHKLNSNAEVTLAQQAYDNVGRLKLNIAGGKTALKTNYTYNVRSWTTAINNSHFKQTLTYVQNNKGYNGNIMAMSWQQDKDTKNRTYTFAYDDLSRLSSATYTGDGKFGTSYSYDKHGNIISIKRDGKINIANMGEIDRVKIEYDGNRMIGMKEEANPIVYSESFDMKKYYNKDAGQYDYNENGSITADRNKGVYEIAYNDFNLPSAMNIKTPSIEGYIKNDYNGAGQKFRSIYRNENVYIPIPSSGVLNASGTEQDRIQVEYVGNKIYDDEGSKSSPKLKQILIENGYIKDGKYYFYIKDHLGNNRIVADANGTVVQSTQYYPFGMAFADGKNRGEQRYKYNGKELEDRYELNQYDYGARFYDPAYGRFSTMDPLAEKGYNWSPYAYCFNNPLSFVDSDGQWPSWSQIKQNAKDVAGAALSFTNGFVRAVGDNLVAGASTAREDGTYTSAAAYNLGQDAGDVVSMVGGAVETVAGAVASIGGTVASPVSGGLSLGATAAGVTATVHGTAVSTSAVSSFSSNKGRVNESNENSKQTVGKRRDNRLLDDGEPNTVSKNKSGTTMKKYGPDGKTQKEWNKGHPQDKNPNGRVDHIHDYKPNNYNPKGYGDRQPARKKYNNNDKRDFNLK